MISSQISEKIPTILFLLISHEIASENRLPTPRHCAKKNDRLNVQFSFPKFTPIFQAGTGKRRISAEKRERIHFDKPQ